VVRATPTRCAGAPAVRDEELARLRATTVQVIAREGTAVALRRSGGLTDDGAGGHLPSDDSSLLEPVQRWFRHPRAAPDAQESDSGERVVRKGVLLGPPGDDLREGDTFQLEGVTWEVQEVLRTDWSTRGSCYSIGDGDGDD
jgi:hypothetical protein